MLRQDLELKKAFADLQVKSLETRREMLIMDCRIISLEKVMDRINKTEKALSIFPENVTAYESIGRMFIKSDVNTVKDTMAERSRELCKRKEEWTEYRNELSAGLKESEENVREIVRESKKQQSPKTYSSHKN